MIISIVVDKLQLASTDNGRHPIVNAQFAIYLTGVEFDSADGDSQFACDFTIRLPVTQQFDDFYFSGSERLNKRFSRFRQGWFW